MKRGSGFLQEKENEFLAPFASMSGSLPEKAGRPRRHDEPDDRWRTRFQLDRDRILYSGSFRRLQYKTQVFVTHEGDLYRTRMTHSLEVMQIARSIACALGLNETLAEAIALVHDIGHAPFGHGGEEELGRLMEGSGGFDHNLHGLRVVDVLEQCYPEFPGLNLCWETREGVARHRTIFDTPSLPEEFAVYGQPSLECQVVNVADVIAWCTHDLDDALRIGLIKQGWLESKAGDVPMLDEVRITMESMQKAVQGLEPAGRGIGRKRAISDMIGKLICDVTDATSGRIEDAGVETVEESRDRESPLVSFSPGVESQVQGLAGSMLDQLYLNPVVNRMVYKGRRIIAELFKTFCEDPGLIPEGLRKGEAQESPERVACDYIAGMTDRYAMDIHDMLFQPHARTTDWF
jgi:dGTPase